MKKKKKKKKEGNGASINGLKVLDAEWPIRGEEEVNKKRDGGQKSSLTGGHTIHHLWKKKERKEGSIIYC